MIENSITTWFGYGCFVALASWSGLQVSRALAWKEAAFGARMPLAFGLALSPFLTGFSVMVPTAILRGASHEIHLAVAGGLLFAMGVFGRGLGVAKGKKLSNAKGGLGVYLLEGFLLMWMGMLGLNAVFLPLIQNDALEYASVGRILFESRDLLSYPAIHPESTSSGFYGPWTHPPLYVALIYLSYVIQGHANEPGLMRLIAPWFLVAAVFALITLGRLASRQTGLLSGILLISTPLLFLGADSALIDALPVAGMVLLLVALVGLQAKQPRYSLTVGSVVGMALWTHSQAILFLPLMAAGLLIQGGLLNLRRTLASVAWAIGAALLVGGGYYLRNYFLWGSLISDSPAVVGIDPSGWQTYFSYARGLDHFFARLQYGLFKGWFCFEAYGPLFWLGIGGIAAFLCSIPRTKLRAVVDEGVARETEIMQVQWTCFIFFITYLLGTAISIIIGSDLMIKNERYLLVMAPVMSIFGGLLVKKGLGSALKQIGDSNAKFFTRDLNLFCLLVAIVTALVAWFYLTVFYRWKDLPFIFFNQSTTEEALSTLQKRSWFYKILSFYPNTALAQANAFLLPKGEPILGLRPADLFYSSQKMTSYLDPSLIYFYSKDEPEKALNELKLLKIRYVQMPDYFTPPVLNSTLSKILGNPNQSDLVYNNHGYQIYKLVQQNRNLKETIDLSPGRMPWTKSIRVRWGGRKSLGALHIFSRPQIDGHSSARFPFFSRDYSTLLSLGKGAALGFNAKLEVPRLSGNSEYRLLLKIKGSGYVTIWIKEFDEYGNMPFEKSVLIGKPIRLGDLILAPGQSEADFQRRFKTLPTTSYVRIGIEHHGMSFIEVEKVTLEKIPPTSFTFP
jgi:4-amino-4-deoxy-L-arabinose transferase-like glycosyltransferase